MQQLRTIILDDEPHWQLVLSRMAASHPLIDVIATAGSLAATVDAIRHHQPDLLLVDVELAEANGIDFVKGLIDPPMVVFITTHPHFALKSYEVDAVDYIVKPVTIERFSAAIDRVLLRRSVGAEALSVPPESADQAPSFFFIKEQNNFIKIRCADILFVKSMENYVQIFTETNVYTTLSALTHIETRLGASFMRVHRSYLVNLEKVESFTHEAIQFGIHEVPLGGQYMDQFKTDFVQRNLLRKSSVA
jgi:DNA-binding LytR/AlgR family response regulator